jgi:hypothetical protein
MRRLSSVTASEISAGKRFGVGVGLNVEIHRELHPPKAKALRNPTVCSQEIADGQAPSFLTHFVSTRRLLVIFDNYTAWTLGGTSAKCEFATLRDFWRLPPCPYWESSRQQSRSHSAR